MSFVEPSSLAGLTSWLAGLRSWAYPLLFLGALLETVLPFALLLPGELVFLAGSVLAGMHQLALLPVVLVLLGGGMAGDHVSYWLGRRYGMTTLQRLDRWPGLRRLLRRRRRALAWLRKRGGRAVFAARLSGPISWVMPTLAGASRLRYLTFVRFNTPGVLLGVGQFIVFGYLAGSHVDVLSAELHRFGIWLLVGMLLVSSVWVWGRRSFCDPARRR